ncbi:MULTISPECIES: hypothetical protein [Leptospira]|uniref:Uncharacterized protein n=4 Tax=Leptospira weilii TaxID=28184 RepID=A0A828YYN3_9LEPT|nr:MULTISPECIES: hypothetical protein [Leptospira]EMM71079.1 hypothetical protein LEP1GSC038_1631 [Leptospira weilii str. 2006001855]EMY14484.1 hypothetical protein LEP1GSC043_2920 [Leptospira weilii str. Ecochallenge]EKR62923.1 hypothetical protein LEP1GSC036_2382 [Leptospira weilii str. 2006001853]EMJ65629.1 hypothetical protein LEP1GSC051_1333 [Leptospira sp. P2653]EMN45194.1 hypothetical protein LEP1GSC086_1290 [Leptospira weilii str. LNT 1234]
MQEQGAKFKNQLERYINYRGIDIVLYLKDGSRVELDRNRKMVGEQVVYFPSKNLTSAVEIASISRAEFFVA